MKLEALCRAAGIEFPPRLGSLEITGISTDSRRCDPGNLYVCICGLRVDGHLYTEQAIRNGAICVLMQEGCEREIPDGICALSCKDTRSASAHLYNAFYGDPCARMKFIGVTGTNGKTSVTHMLRAILEASLCKCGIVGTVGCESLGKPLNIRGDNPLANMTTPDPPELYKILARMAEDGVEYVIMEATSHALTLGKLAPIRFEAGIFTNLTPDHLDFHKTMQAYAAAKASLFPKCKLSVINVDSAYADQMISASAGRVVTCGERKAADYRAEAVKLLGRDGVEFVLRSNRARLRLQCPVAGSFTVTNAMQAAVCAMELGFGTPVVKSALASLSGVKGRMERVRLGVGANFDVMIDYAHTPDALEKLIRTAKDAGGDHKRVVLVFGCGGDRDKSKRPMMGEIAETYADEVVVTSDNSRSEDPQNIIDDILEGMRRKNVTVIPNRAEAIRYAILHAREGDLILLAGKGHEEYEINQNGKMRFSEREIVRAAYRDRAERERTEE